MTQEQLLARAQQEIKSAKALKVKIFKFDKGEIHPTIAADYNRQRKALLYKLNNIEDFAKKEWKLKIPGLHQAKQTLWSLLVSIKYRMSDI